jgi:hypothetical protein
MNTEQSACASSGKTTAWAQIDWPQHERQVRKLQARIVKVSAGVQKETFCVKTKGDTVRGSNFRVFRARR